MEGLQQIPSQKNQITDLKAQRLINIGVSEIVEIVRFSNIFLISTLEKISLTLTCQNYCFFLSFQNNKRLFSYMFRQELLLQLKKSLNEPDL